MNKRILVGKIIKDSLKRDLKIFDIFLYDEFIKGKKKVWKEKDLNEGLVVNFNALMGLREEINRITSDSSIEFKQIPSCIGLYIMNKLGFIGRIRVVYGVLDTEDDEIAFTFESQIKTKKCLCGREVRFDYGTLKEEEKIFCEDCETEIKTRTENTLLDTFDNIKEGQVYMLDSKMPGFNMEEM